MIISAQLIAQFELDVVINYSGYRIFHIFSISKGVLLELECVVFRVITKQKHIVITTQRSSISSQVAHSRVSTTSWSTTLSCGQGQSHTESFLIVPT